MITCKDSVIQIEGEPNEICKDLTYIFIGFKETLEKEFELSEDECQAVIAECGKVAFMNELERKHYLDSLESNL